jgi:tetratricopeptide (TPR) repeat protein
MTANAIEQRFERLRSSPISAVTGTLDITGIGTFAAEAARAGRADLSLDLLQSLTLAHPDAALLWRLLGFTHRDEQRMEESLVALAKAHGLDPQDPVSAFANAQIHFETGRPAATLFQQAQRIAPDNPAITRSTAAALAAEGDLAGALALLDQAVTRNPGWIDGHKLLSNLRATSATPDDPARSYRQACAQNPKDKSLRLAWFHTVAQTRDWDAARAILDDGERIFGAQMGFTLGKIFIASESGEAAQDDSLFDSVAHIHDAGLDLCQIRHALRAGRLDQAEAIGMRNVGTAAATMFWPYLSLVWRLTGDGRAGWLDGDPRFIRSFDLGFSNEELSTLAQTLRSLHSMHAPYLDQSVRGGTQTDRPLFFRHDPVIQLVRSRVTQAVRDYVDGLPPHDPSHPLLGVRRDKILFEGSWSVRLLSQGFHACHTHPMGWISSALYVSLPTSEEMGTPPAGWLSFGTPPPELGLDLPRYAQVEPKPGRLVLFPSTMWHGTEPFDDGERLTIAFDVRRPVG